ATDLRAVGIGPHLIGVMHHEGAEPEDAPLDGFEQRQIGGGDGHVSGPYTNSRCYTAPMRDDSLPLDGLIVLDLTRVLAGPYCTRLLADLGARVIKVELPGEGDEMRRSPHQLGQGRGDQRTYFTQVHAGQQSVGLDLTSPRGQEVLLDLARRAAVFVENFM